MLLYTVIKIVARVQVIENSAEIVFYIVNMNGFPTLQLSFIQRIIESKSINMQIKLFPKHYKGPLFTTSILGFNCTLLSLHTKFPFSWCQFLMSWLLDQAEKVRDKLCLVISDTIQFLLCIMSGLWQTPADFFFKCNLL